MSIKPHVNETRELAKMVEHLAARYDGTKERSQGILEVIVGFAYDLPDNKKDLADIIGAAEKLAQRGILNHRDVRDQLIEPLCPEFETSGRVRSVVCACG